MVIQVVAAAHATAVVVALGAKVHVTAAARPAATQMLTTQCRKSVLLRPTQPWRPSMRVELRPNLTSVRPAPRGRKVKYASLAPHAHHRQKAKQRMVKRALPASPGRKAKPAKASVVVSVAVATAVAAARAPRAAAPKLHKPRRR
jgi:hypothetical protein